MLNKKKGMVINYGGEEKSFHHVEGREQKHLR